MGRQPADHFTLVRRGLELHEARKYRQAFRYFERASALAPECPTVTYNLANTLHMLGSDDESYRLLRSIIEASLGELREACPECGPRGLQSDALFLMAIVVQHSRGDCVEALAYALQHLNRRHRGVSSLFTIRDVRARIKSIRSGIESAETKPSGVNRRERF